MAIAPDVRPRPAGLRALMPPCFCEWLSLLCSGDPRRPHTASQREARVQDTVLPVPYQRREAPFRPEGEAGTVVRAGVARPGLPCRTGQRGPAAERPLSPSGLQVPEFSRCVSVAGGSRAQLCVLGGFRGGAGGLACAPGASALQPHAEEAPSRHHRHTWWRCRPQLVLPRFLHLSIEGLTITGARKRLLGKVNSVATEGDVFCSKDTCQTSS